MRRTIDAQLSDLVQINQVDSDHKRLRMTGRGQDGIIELQAKEWSVGQLQDGGKGAGKKEAILMGTSQDFLETTGEHRVRRRRA